MRNFILIIAIIVGFSSLKANDAFKVTYKQISSKEINLEFKLGEYNLIQTELNNIQYTRIVFDHSITTNKKGYAELPYLHASIELMDNKNVSIKVEEGEYTDYQLETDLIPSRGTIYRSQNKDEVPYVIDPASIKDTWYPKTLASSTEPYIIKDKRGINIYVYPFVYNSKKKVLRVYKSLKIKVISNSSTPVNPLYNKTNEVLPEMQSVYQSIFINYNQNSKDNLTINQYGDILLITTSRDETAVEPYIKWKQEKGFNVEKQVVNTDTNVKDLIKERYNANNNILYVVLVGDWDDIKSDKGPQDGPMDPQLGCVVGTDNVADIIIGRISANRASDVTTQVNKFINYEQNPENGANWYSAALGIASDEGGPSQDKGDDNEADTTHQRVIFEDKLSHFTFSEFYKAFDPGANVNDVKSAVESGVSIINYTGHGSMTSWSTTGFSNSNVNQLTNNNKLPIVFSVACNNGDFHQGTCFAESWLRKENGGAVIMLAASISQPWDEPMRGQDYIADLIIGGYNYDEHEGQNGINTTEQRSIVGSIVFNAFVLMISESDGINDWETVKTWNIFGDPTLQIRTEAPKELSLSNSVIISDINFETIVTSGGNPVKGALVCISNNDAYYSAISDEQGHVSIEHSLLPGAGKLVVTSFNSTTINNEIIIISPDGPYVIAYDYSINDASGNNNGLLDYNETVFLDVTAKNVGTDTAFNVSATLLSSDLHVSISDNSQQYFTMVSNTTTDGPDAFEFTLSDDVPDQHVIEFAIEFKDITDEKWTSTLSILANAPTLSIGEIIVNDSSTGNNDGILDAGETAELEIEVENIGHAKSILGSAKIITSSSDLIINSSDKELVALSPNEKHTLSFNVTAMAEVELETSVVINCETVSGKYTFSKDITLLIGKIPEYLMKNGTFEVSIGEFMDTGGENSDYNINENYTITFKPQIIGDTVVIDFLSFNTEQDYDFMYIYDGLNASANQIGNNFSGTDSPGKIQASNPDGALTIKFTSDNYINAPGWFANITTLAGPTVAINSEKSEGFTFYPNPTTSTINIKVKSESSVNIFDLTGRIVMSKQLKPGLNIIDISSLQTGNYIISIIGKGINSAKKLIIN